MSEFILSIPQALLDVANRAFLEVVGGPYMTPWDITQARGATRADARLYIQWEWLDEATTLAYRDAVVALGGTSRETKRGTVRAVDPVTAAKELGEQKRPDLPLKQTKDLVAMALELGIAPTPKEREALIDLLEERLTKGEP